MGMLMRRTIFNYGYVHENTFFTMIPIEFMRTIFTMDMFIRTIFNYGYVHDNNFQPWVTPYVHEKNNF